MGPRRSARWAWGSSATPPVGEGAAGWLTGSLERHWPVPRTDRPRGGARGRRPGRERLVARAYGQRREGDGPRSGCGPATPVRDTKPSPLFGVYLFLGFG